MSCPPGDDIKVHCGFETKVEFGVEREATSLPGGDDGRGRFYFFFRPPTGIREARRQSAKTSRAISDTGATNYGRLVALRDMNGCADQGYIQVIVKVYDDRQTLGQAAAEHAAASLRTAIRELGSARIIAATGTSQFEFLEALTAMPEVSWQSVELFHLDEYIGLSCAHPASFRRYLLDRLIRKVGIPKYHLLDGEGQPAEVIHRTGSALQSRQVDVAFVGIGENAHLAFNDPPADFETEEPFLVVELDEACRRQQVGEGWFREVVEVPRQAITMSIRQILKAGEILAIVPDARKAEAVKACCEGAVSALAPASILQRHPNTTLFLDRDSARLLSAKTTARL